LVNLSYLTPSSRHNLKLTLTYDGAAYLGWQKTAMGSSIEAILQNILERILQHPITLQAASRTDAGVHANQQVVNFFTSKSFINLERLRLSLNRLLPKDIIILIIEEAPFSFHPSLDAVRKEYHYYICTGSSQLPIHRFYSWHVPYVLDYCSIQKALSTIIGTYDFTAFCNRTDKISKDNFCTIYETEILSLAENRFYFRIHGNRFLYNMVRILVGTLIDIGKYKISLDSFSALLKSNHHRSFAGVTAPPHGLFLHRVQY
jgi:tRNA pseudouridine38-40 synthase